MEAAIEVALDRFEDSLRDLASCLSERRAGEEDVEAVTAAIETLIAVCVDAEQNGTPETTPQLRERVLARTGPWLHQGKCFYRATVKPAGYPGDYLLLDTILQDKASGSGLDWCLDRFYLGHAGSRAVRSRARWLRERLRDELAARGRLSFADVGCGSCRDIVQVLAEAAPGTVTALCVDIDQSALAYAQQVVVENAPEAPVQWQHLDVYDFVRGRARLGGESPDVIVAVGLLAYLRDRFASHLLGRLHSALAPGGTLVAGNFHPSNPSRPHMEWLMDWHLIYRTEADLRRLAEEAQIDSDLLAVETEPLGINLMLVARK